MGWSRQRWSYSFHFDRFNITIPGTVSNCVDESNSLTVQGQHGIGNLTLAYFNLTTDPITSCSSADVPTLSAGTQSYYGMFFFFGRGNSNDKLYPCDVLARSLDVFVGSLETNEVASGRRRGLTHWY